MFLIFQYIKAHGSEERNCSCNRGLQVQVAVQVKGYQCSWLVNVLIAEVKFTVTTFMNSHRKPQMASGVWVPVQMLLSIGPDIGLYPQLE